MADVQMAGLEFTPNPAATMERARTQLRTPFLKIVKFSNDDLDMVRPHNPFHGKERSVHRTERSIHGTERSFHDNQQMFHGTERSFHPVPQNSEIL
jgi:hypothetical protein